MQRISDLFIKLSAIIIGFVIAVGVIYSWLLPVVLKGYKTYAFLLIGLGAAAVLAGYYSYRAAESLESSAMRWLSASGIGLLTALLVGLLSFLIIFNLRGS